MTHHRCFIESMFALYPFHIVFIFVFVCLLLLARSGFVLFGLVDSSQYAHNIILTSILRRPDVMDVVKTLKQRLCAYFSNKNFC